MRACVCASVYIYVAIYVSMCVSFNMIEFVSKVYVNRVCYIILVSTCSMISVLLYTTTAVMGVRIRYGLNIGIYISKL